MLQAGFEFGEPASIFPVAPFAHLAEFGKTGDEFVGKLAAGITAGVGPVKIPVI